MKSYALLLVLASFSLLGQPPTYTISTIAGNGKSGYSGDGGPALSAEMDITRGIVTDPAGNVYVCDEENNVIREINTSGTISTVVGTGVAGYNGQNIAGTQAELHFPYRLAMDPPGNLYIADEANSLIRKLGTNGILTNVAGIPGICAYSGDGGSAASAGLCVPLDTVVDTAGNIFIADTLNNVIRKIDTNGIITTVAGNGKGAGQNVGSYDGPGSGTGGYSGDGGPATSAELNYPVSIAVDAAGNLYIADQYNNVVRQVNPQGIINTYAGHYGSSGLNYSGDRGPATSAGLNLPAGVAVDTAGDLYIADSNNNVIREVLTNGIIYTIAGNGTQGYSGDGGVSTAAELNQPRSVAIGTFGDIYIADTYNNVVRELTPGTTTVGHVTNAFGNAPLLAANTWIALKGANLSKPGDSRVWQASDFVNGQMPTALDGVSVTITGPNNYQSNAYVYYISPSQINILAPPDLPAGLVQVQVDNNGADSFPGQVNAQTLSPSLFVANGGPYVLGVHLNGSLLGPTSLYPGESTPAAPGETIVLFGNGFGATSTPVVAGASEQSGSLATTPSITIGTASAQVTFAGLISPGLYQFNVVVPETATAGDNSITVTYNGSSTQAGTLITIQ